MSSNPYQMFFDELDAVVARLTDKNEILDTVDFDKAADLLKRAGFVLANIINIGSRVYPMLWLEPEPIKGEVDGTDDSSLEES